MMDERTAWLHFRAGITAGKEKTCFGKFIYSEESANKAAEKMNKKPTTRNVLEAYSCAFCGHWHVGRKMSKEELESYV